MFEFLADPVNAPFSVALAIVMALAVLEVVGLFIGASFASLDAPDAGLDVDADADLDVDGADGPLVGALSWLGLGRAPLIVVLVAFCTAFGLGGLMLQAAIAGVFGGPLPAVLASVAALAPSLLVTRVLAVAFARIIPKEETYAVSESSLVGRAGVVTTGTARADLPAEVCVQDQFRRDAYVRVVPEEGTPDLPQGTMVVLVSLKDSLFTAIEASFAAGSRDAMGLNADEAPSGPIRSVVQESLPNANK